MQGQVRDMRTCQMLVVQRLPHPSHLPLAPLLGTSSGQNSAHIRPLPCPACSHHDRPHFNLLAVPCTVLSQRISTPIPPHPFFSRPYSPDRPHVDLLAVVRTAQQQLRGAVPSRGHVVRDVNVLVLRQLPGEPKVTQLELAHRPTACYRQGKDSSSSSQASAQRQVSVIAYD